MDKTRRDPHTLWQSLRGADRAGPVHGVQADEAEHPHRRRLIQALGAGLLAAFLPAGAQSAALSAGFLGSRPSRLPPGQSIYRLSGRVLVNGVAATPQSRITAGDTVETTLGSEIIFVVGDNAMILRDGSRLEMRAAPSSSSLLAGLRLLTGALLSVSAGRSMQVRTATAAIGIRGTGFYVESNPELTYFCTCYGVTDVVASADPASRETVASSRHDKSLYIRADASSGEAIRPAPFINHSDQELMLIETLVGRTTPFVFPGSEYGAPRRDY